MTRRGSGTRRRPPLRTRRHRDRAPCVNAGSTPIPVARWSTGGKPPTTRAWRCRAATTLPIDRASFSRGARDANRRDIIFLSLVLFVIASISSGFGRHQSGTLPCQIRIYPKDMAFLCRLYVGTGPFPWMPLPRNNACTIHCVHSCTAPSRDVLQAGHRRGRMQTRQRWTSRIGFLQAAA